MTHIPRQTTSKTNPTSSIPYIILLAAVGAVGLGAILACLFSCIPAYRLRKAKRQRRAYRRSASALSLDSRLELSDEDGLDELHSSFHGRRSLWGALIGHERPLLPVSLGLENVAVVSTLDYDPLSQPETTTVRIPFAGEPTVSVPHSTVPMDPADVPGEIRAMTNTRVVSMVLDGDKAVRFSGLHEALAASSPTDRGMMSTLEFSLSTSTSNNNQPREKPVEGKSRTAPLEVLAENETIWEQQQPIERIKSRIRIRRPAVSSASSILSSTWSSESLTDSPEVQTPLEESPPRLHSSPRVTPNIPKDDESPSRFASLATALIVPEDTENLANRRDLATN